MPVRRDGAIWYCVSKPDAWDLLARLARPGTSAGSGRSPPRCSARPTPRWRWSPARRWAAGAFGPSLPWSAQLRDQHRGDHRRNRYAGRRPGPARQSAPAGTSPTGSSGTSWKRRTPTRRASCGRRCRTCCRPSPRRPPVSSSTPLTPGSAAAACGPCSTRRPRAPRSRRPTHTGLLWALEALAWSPEYLGAAALSLARLAQIDPGGRWANRPDHSLNQIFLPWQPQTAATREDRLAVVDMLRAQGAGRRLALHDRPAADPALGQPLLLHAALARLAARARSRRR